jgi:Mitochondrial ribosomal protein L37
MLRITVVRRVCQVPFRTLFPCGSSNGPTDGHVRCFSVVRSTPRVAFPLKSGTPIPGLDIYKDKEPPVALERHEYPDWLESLAKPLPSLAVLRRMPEEEATDREKMRYLKLTRRVQIKNNNEALAGTKR